MRPGSSSVIGSTSLPWKRARVCSTPSARSGSTISANHEVISESRPKSVMNHGAPAATTARRHDHLEHREVHRHLCGLAEPHPGAAPHRAPLPPEVDATVDRLDAGVTRRLDAALLDDEEIREVGVDLQLDGAVRGLLAVV